MRPLDMRWSDSEVAENRIPDELREPYILLGIKLLGWLHNREVGFIRDHRLINVSELYALRWIRSEEGVARVTDEMYKIGWSLELQLFGFEGKPVYRVRFVRNSKYVLINRSEADVEGEYYSPWVYAQNRIDTTLSAAIMAIETPVRFAEKFEEPESEVVKGAKDYLCMKGESGGPVECGAGDPPDIQPGSDYPL